MFADKGGWRVSWREAGRRRSKWFQTKPEAKRFEAELAIGTANTGQSEKASPTFRRWAEHWFEHVCLTEKAESQWVKDRETLDTHLLPALGDRKLSILRKADLLNLKSELRGKKARGKDKALSPKTVNNILALAKRIMACAVDHEMVQENPWKSVKLFKLPERDFRFWKPSERDHFLEAAEGLDPAFTRLVAVAVMTGLRLGELAALTRADLDFERKVIRVRATWHLHSRQLTPTKGKEVATIEMNSVVQRALEPARFLPEPTDWVFERALFWSARHRLGRLAGRVGVPAIRFHDLRHTFASCLAMAGVPLLSIQQFLRHKSYQMTLRYAHLHPDHLAGTLEVLTRSATRPENAEAKSGGPRGT